jgi:hypothetical protein
MLSHDQERQARLREEVVDARAAHGGLDYDWLMGLRASTFHSEVSTLCRAADSEPSAYLDAICRETLRL